MKRSPSKTIIGKSSTTSFCLGGIFNRIFQLAEDPLSFSLAASLSREEVTSLFQNNNARSNVRARTLEIVSAFRSRDLYHEQWSNLFIYSYPAGRDVRLYRET